MTISQLVETLHRQATHLIRYHRSQTLYALSINQIEGQHRLYNPDGQPLPLELPPHLLLVALHTGDLQPGPFDPRTPNPEAWITVFFYRPDTEPHWY